MIQQNIFMMIILQNSKYIHRKYIKLLNPCFFYSGRASTWLKQFSIMNYILLEYQAQKLKVRYIGKYGEYDIV